MPPKKTFILKLGGSIVSPSKDKINVEYLKKLKELITTYPEYKFMITVGGGYTCRWYQESLQNNGFEDEMMQHSIGIAACNFNAELVRLVFSEIAHDKVFLGIGSIHFEEQVLIGGTWTPGVSSNYDAVEVATLLGSKDLVNLSNIDYIYDKDPNKFTDAKKIESITWQEYRVMFNLDKHLPGQHIPIDVIAADLASVHKIRFLFTDGHDLENLKNIFDGNKFKGTLIG